MDDKKGGGVLIIIGLEDVIIDKVDSIRDIKIG